MAAEAPVKKPILKTTLEHTFAGALAGLGLLLGLAILPNLPWLVGAGAVIAGSIGLVRAVVSNMTV